MSCVLGLTGMTGAGKSTVAMYFERMGAKIVDADVIARKAIFNEDVIKNLCLAFGKDILDENGQVIRSALAKKAFTNSLSAKQLSKITHPFILEEMHRQVLEYKGSNAGIIIVDAPLLYQSGGDKMCDKVIFVNADRDVKLKRIMVRDGLTEKQAEDRLNVQQDMVEYEGRADYIIINNGEINELYSQCDKIIERIG